MHVPINDTISTVIYITSKCNVYLNRFFFMVQVGRYEDSQIDSLVPHINELDPDVAKLFQMVFRKDPKVRPSALELLNVPKISEAHEYKKYFETCRCT